MEKFIYFDLDDTLIHENKSLTPDTIRFLENLTQIKYGICTNRPLSDSKDLPFLKQVEQFICEGGVVSYRENNDILHTHPLAIKVNHQRVLELALVSLKESGIDSSIRQNKSRIYTSTLTFDTEVDLKSIGDFIIKNYPLNGYHFIALGKHKICLTIKGISKEYMIDAIAKENYHYFLISDDEPKVENLFNSKLNYISINPDNHDFNKRCLYVSERDFELRLIDAIEFVINHKLI